MKAKAPTAITRRPIKPPTKPGSKPAFDPEESEEFEGEDGDPKTALLTQTEAGQTPHSDMVVRVHIMSDEQAGLHWAAQLAGAQLPPVEDGAGDCVMAAGDADRKSNENSATFSNYNL